MNRRTVIAAGCATVGAAACWSAAVLGGLDAARWCAAACVALVTLAVLATVRPQRVAAPPRHGPTSTIVHPPYPRYTQLLSVVDWSLRDRRYHDRVLVPLLREIAADADDAQAVAALGAEITARLDRSERRTR